MNIFRITGDLSHLFSIFILMHKMRTSRSCAGISFKSQLLYLVVYVARYLGMLYLTVTLVLFVNALLCTDIFTTFTHSYYNSLMKIVFIVSSAYTLYLMVTELKPTHDPNIDTFKIEYLIGGSAVLAILFPYKYNLSEMLWAFSIWLESVAILPQLFMLQRTGEAETITTHYLFALGAYRTLYIPNWMYRYLSEGHFDPISTLAGLVQTVLYSDFFYIYWTKCVFLTVNAGALAYVVIGS